MLCLVVRLKMCLINGKDYNYYLYADLKKYCTFKIGGKAKYVVEVYNIPALINVCYKCKLHNIKYKAIGLGANLLFSDAGFDGVIIVNKASQIMFRKTNVYATSGVVVSNLISKCIEHNLSGLEYLAGIPSTVGGAITNSLGAFNADFANFVEYVVCLDLNNFKIVKLDNSQCQFGYRTSIFKSGNFIILKTKLKLQHLDKAKIKENFLVALNKKISTQPLNYPSAGSVFKRTDVIPAKLIDELGLKGLRTNGASVSTKHAGFIINEGGASSSDVIDLINKIKAKVKKAYQVDLPLEIEIVE